MTAGEFAEKLGMRVLTGASGLEREVSGIYICDLLSWVMSHADRGDAWVTVLTNINVVAVAVMTEVACVIIPEGIAVEEQLLRKAGEEGVAVLGSGLTSYEIACKAGPFIGNGSAHA